jgi:NAD(P)-dependent dehydrogenase (short-subunit alcohol dehydrogenase family)
MFNASSLFMNKVAIITGGSRGIGAATAKLAGERGYSVCVNYRNDSEAADRVVSIIKSAGGRAIAVQADVSIETEVMRLFDIVDAQLGRISALVNNAGVLEKQMRLDIMDAARIQRVFATNVVGAFLCAREAVRRMSTRYAGHGGVTCACSRRSHSNDWRSKTTNIGNMVTPAVE